jgi:hypothetical protein
MNQCDEEQTGMVGEFNDLLTPRRSSDRVAIIYLLTVARIRAGCYLCPDVSSKACFLTTQTLIMEEHQPQPMPSSYRAHVCGYDFLGWICSYPSTHALVHFLRLALHLSHRHSSQHLQLFSLLCLLPRCSMVLLHSGLQRLPGSDFLKIRVSVKSCPFSAAVFSRMSP